MTAPSRSLHPTGHRCKGKFAFDVFDAFLGTPKKSECGFDRVAAVVAIGIKRYEPGTPTTTGTRSKPRSENWWKRRAEAGCGSGCRSRTWKARRRSGTWKRDPNGSVRELPRRRGAA